MQDDKTPERPSLFFQIPPEKRVSHEFSSGPAGSAEEEFRHSGWKPLRQRVFDAMLKADLSATRLEHFASCGRGTQIWHKPDTGEIRLTASYCHDRFCQPCARARGHELQAAMRQHIPRGVDLRFVTLTIRHSSLPLVEVLARLRKCFNALRGRRWWKQHVSGGVQVLEVKLSKSGEWHPHLHMILQGKYMPKEELSAEWHAVTGDSFIVDVRRVAESDDEMGDLGRYLVKYVTKPAGLDLYCQEEKFVEYILAMKGQRIMNFLGSWRGIMADDQEEPDKISTETGWIMLARYSELAQRAAAGEEFAARVLAGLSHKLPQDERQPLLVPDTA